MWHDGLTLVDCGVDWFTTTAIDGKTATLLGLRAENIVWREEREGGLLRPWSMSGYSGWRCGRIEYGFREDGAIMRLTSSLAASEWWSAWQITERASRIDLQATFRCECDPSAIVFLMRALAGEFYEGRTDGPKLTLWSDSENGATLYCGSRSSSLYFRCYNKEVQSRLPEWSKCVRVELEVKNRSCVPVVNHLISTGNVQQGCLALLSQYMSDRGISTNLATAVPCCLNNRLPPRDVNKLLSWLSKAVKPTLERLIEAGYEQEMRSAIGLPNDAGDCPL